MTPRAHPDPARFAPGGAPSGTPSAHQRNTTARPATPGSEALGLIPAETPPVPYGTFSGCKVVLHPELTDLDSWDRMEREAQAVRDRIRLLFRELGPFVPREEIVAQAIAEICPGLPETFVLGPSATHLP